MKEQEETCLICVVILIVSFFLIIILTSPRISITGLATEKETTAEEVEKSSEGQQPRELTRAEALDTLLGLEKEIREMETFGLDTYFVKDTLLLAKQAYTGNNLNMVRDEYSKETNKEKREYLLSLLYDKTVISDKITNLSEVYRVKDVIILRKKQAYKILDETSLFEDEISKNKEQGIGTAECESLLAKAKTSLKEERYDEAEDYLAVAEEKLETSKTELTRVKKLIAMSRGFFEKYWLQIIATFLIITVLTLITANELRTKLMKDKLRMLKMKRETVKELIKKVQDDRFNKAKISDSAYGIKIDKYREELAEINRTIPLLEAMLEKKGKKEKPRKEQEGIIKVEK